MLRARALTRRGDRLATSDCCCVWERCLQSQGLPAAFAANCFCSVVFLLSRRCLALPVESASRTIWCKNSSVQTATLVNLVFVATGLCPATIRAGQPCCMVGCRLRLKVQWWAVRCLSRPTHTAHSPSHRLPVHILAIPDINACNEHLSNPARTSIGSPCDMHA